MNFSSKEEIFAAFREGMELVVSRCRLIKGSKTDKTSPANRELWKVLYRVFLADLNAYAEEEKWESARLIDCRLRLFYCALVVNLETRNKIVAYDYMDFARRVGEVWESFCKICWETSPDGNLKRMAPPTFASVKAELLAVFAKLVEEGNPSNAKEVIAEYNKVVETLGNINLKEDEYFAIGDERYVIDFKSGFGSNEKGNTERLLTVAKIFATLPEKHECILVVRAAEDEGNNYLKVLKSSGLWKVYCGPEAYEYMRKVTGFDLSSWIRDNIDFKSDMETSAYQHLSDSDLIKYLVW